MRNARPLPPPILGLVTGAGHRASERTDRRSIVRIGRRMHRSWTKTLLAPFALVGLAAGIAASAAPAQASADTRIVEIETAGIAALVPGHECALAKRKAALRRLSAINACYKRPPQLGNQQPNPMCLTKADQRFQRDFLRIEANGACVPATGDAAAVESLVDECAVGLVILLPGTCQAAGSSCGGSNPPCCTGLVCSGAIGQSPRCN